MNEIILTTPRGLTYCLIPWHHKARPHIPSAQTDIRQTFRRVLEQDYEEVERLGYLTQAEDYKP